MDERVERYNVGERFDYNRFFFLMIMKFINYPYVDCLTHET